MRRQPLLPASLLIRCGTMATQLVHRFTILTSKSKCSSLEQPFRRYILLVVVFGCKKFEFRQEVLHLTPSSQSLTSQTGGMMAKLEGDLASYQTPLILQGVFPSHHHDGLNIRQHNGAGKVLLVPKSPDLTNVNKYMLVDLSRITMDGSECNKVGVSYAAFNNQVNSVRLFAYFSFCLVALMFGTISAPEKWERVWLGNLKTFITLTSPRYSSRSVTKYCSFLFFFSQNTDESRA